MKATAVYKLIRDALKSQLASVGLSRLKSSPPAYDRAGGYGRICLWFKVSSGSWDEYLGGRFTGALQSAPTSHPGIEWMSGQLVSRRIWRLLSELERQEAFEIHNRITSHFETPPAHHWLFSCNEEVVQSSLDDLKPLPNVPAAEYDFWFRYRTEEDVRTWADFIQRILPASLHRLEEQLD